MARIDQLNARLDQLSKEFTSKKEGELLRKELITMIDKVHVETLDLKTKVYEQEISTK